MIEKFIHILNYIVIIFGVICALTLIGLIVHKIYIEWRKKKLTELREVYKNNIEHGLRSAEFLKRYIEFEAFSDVIIDMFVDKDELKVLLLDTFISKYPYSTKCMLSKDDIKQFLRDHGVVEYYTKKRSD